LQKVPLLWKRNAWGGEGESKGTPSPLGGDWERREDNLRLWPWSQKKRGNGEQQKTNLLRTQSEAKAQKKGWGVQDFNPPKG